MYRILLTALILATAPLTLHADDADSKMAEVEAALDDREALARLTPLEAQEVRTLRMQAEQHLDNGNETDAERDLDRALERLDLD